MSTDDLPLSDEDWCTEEEAFAWANQDNQLEDDRERKELFIQLVKSGFLVEQAALQAKLSIDKACDILRANVNPEIDSLADRLFIAEVIRQGTSVIHEISTGQITSGRQAPVTTFDPNRVSLGMRMDAAKILIQAGLKLKELVEPVSRDEASKSLKRAVIVESNWRFK